MTTTHVGAGIALGVALPGPNDVAVSADASLSVAYPELDAQITALNAQLTALATMPPLPDYESLLASANALVAAITAAKAIPTIPPPPSIADNIAALSAQVTALVATRADVAADLTVIAAQIAAYAQADIDAYVFSGPRNTLGAELSAIIPGGDSSQAWAVTLVTGTAATWTAMQSIFKTA